MSKFLLTFLQSPAGSSTGSATGVAAGFATLGLGTETDGSTVYPATRAGLYGLKMAHGVYSMAGTLPFHPDFDSFGLFAKSPTDLAYMLEVFSPNSAVSAAENRSWENLRIGFLDPNILLLGPGDIKPNENFDRETVSAYAPLYNTILISRSLKPFRMLQKEFEPLGVRWWKG
jgi:amidase